ncbi:hypothetical protein BD779DRAFT_1559383 [Infundibulicybe gibba]|nr:hypothetical protein BD779DRAFT_1559383 [Infundibulicybe gibba]
MTIPNPASTTTTHTELAWEPDDAWKKALKERLDAEATAKVERALQDYEHRSDDLFFDQTVYNQYHETMNNIRIEAKESYDAGVENERQERKRWALQREQWDLFETFSARNNPIALPPTSPTLLIYVEESGPDTGTGIIVDNSPVVTGTLWSGISAPALEVPARSTPVEALSPVAEGLWAEYNPEERSNVVPIPSSPSINPTPSPPALDPQQIPGASPITLPTSPGPAVGDLDVWEDRLSRHERSLDRREEILGAREREVSRELSAVQRKKDRFKERKANLDLRERSLERKERMQDEGEKELRRKEETLQRKIEKFRVDEADLERRRKECEERAGELDIIRADLDQKLARATLNSTHDRSSATHTGAWSSSVKPPSSRPLTPDSPDGFRRSARSSTAPSPQFLSPDSALPPSFTGARHSPGSSSSKLPSQTPSPRHHRATLDEEPRGREPGVPPRYGPEIKEHRAHSHPRKRSTTPTPRSKFNTNTKPPASPRQPNTPLRNLFGESPSTSHQTHARNTSAPAFHPPMAHKTEKLTTKLERQINEGTLRWNMFPWPMLDEPSNLEDITLVLVSEYVHSPLYPDQDKSVKERVRDQLKRWHPDRFDAPFLHKVRTVEREEVRAGAGLVTRHLTCILSSDRSP